MDSAQAPDNRPAYYIRAIVVGVLMGIVINLWVPYSAYVVTGVFSRPLGPPDRAAPILSWPPVTEALQSG